MTDKEIFSKCLNFRLSAILCSVFLFAILFYSKGKYPARAIVFTLTAVFVFGLAVSFLFRSLSLILKTYKSKERRLKIVAILYCPLILLLAFVYMLLIRISSRPFVILFLYIMPTLNLLSSFVGLRLLSKMGYLSVDK